MTKHDQAIELLEELEKGQFRMETTQDIWQNKLLFWICKALHFLLSEWLRNHNV